MAPMRDKTIHDDVTSRTSGRRGQRAGLWINGLRLLQMVPELRECSSVSILLLTRPTT
jgi:hypothetical protein